MPTINTLTDSKCRSAKPTEKARKMFDGGGLYLFVTPQGGKIWRLAYRFEGKPKTMSFGPYPEVSLAAARAKRDEAKALLRDKINPMAERQPAAAKSKTLQQASETYWAGRSDLTEGYRKNAERGIEMHLFPSLGGRDIGSITREDLLAELSRMDAAGLHVYVRKVRMWVGQVFDWAVEQGYAKENPAMLINPKKAFGRATVEHFAALELRDLPDFLARLNIEGSLQSVLACRMLGLTWTRTTELRMMRWDEIEGKVWRVPAGRMKRRKYHLVPLSRQALDILDVMRARSRGSEYVFPSDRRVDRPMSENSILYLLHRIGYKGRMTGHGWRAVASTWANENGYSKDAIERQLAHSPEDKIRAVYNRAEYMPEREAMLQAWADWLDSHNADAGLVEGGQAPARRLS